MSGLNYKKLGSTLSNICNTTQLDNATKCHYTFKNFWGEPCCHTGPRFNPFPNKLWFLRVSNTNLLKTLCKR